MVEATLRLIYSCLAVALLASIAYCQTTAVQQMRSAFSSSPVTRVTLSGDANWYAGSLKDSGTVTLTAASDGSAQMQLNLGTTGERIESQLAIGPGMKCQWSGPDGKVHQQDYFVCLKPLTWFMPSLGLQSASMPTSITFADLGTESTPEGSFRHVRAQFASAAFTGDANTVGQLTATVMDIDLDPASSLPVRLRYSVRPDSGADVKIPIVVKFSDYRNINGTEIPYRIERYVNGTLQLQITLQSSHIE
ncbi:hypothetical protein [Edaphobacter sp.]|uniref:hypothetical protein n=1 Tax=Edaphobacter sp. TaxID=1934404 RepID=UPI002DBD72B0|nr:hypothetical protein [Edaphobacter sp.]HEU5340214.1 hypothetical protein [Edaphobacter sp.]